jgi:hypothetical protein
MSVGDAGVNLMRGQGIHYALDKADQTVLEEIQTDAGLFSLMEIIARCFKERCQVTDKAWEAIHRCLTDGKFEYGQTPLHQCILCSDNMYEGQPETWYIGYNHPEEVKEIAAAIQSITKSWMRNQYSAIDPADYARSCVGLLSEEDFEYTWRWFLPLRAFYRRAAEKNRGVLFKGELMH